MRTIIRNRKKIHSLKRGFTLVELLVAVTLFSFVALMVSTIVFSANAVNERLAASRTVYEAINLVMDDMSREISQGTKYRCLPSNEFTANTPEDITKPRDCDNTEFGIAFRPSDYSSYATSTTAPVFTNQSPLVSYVLISGAIRRYMGIVNFNVGTNKVDYAVFGRGFFDTTLSGSAPGKNEIISPANMLITKFSITATNTGSYVEDSSNIGQAFIQVVIEGRTITNPIVTFSVQNTITQREPEN
jgi:prepilin-type N-terminal cleavage/methylation domain-containing protein